MGNSIFSKKWLRIAAGCVILALAGAYVAWRYVTAPYSGKDTWVYVRADMDRDALKSELTSKLGSWGGHAFRIFESVASENANAHGAYLVTEGERVKDFAKRLVRHRQNPVKVTLNNLRLMDDVANRMAEQMEFDSRDFLAACDSVLPGYGFKKPQYIAAFLPDTYEFYWTLSARDAVERLVGYRNRFWSDERRAQAAAMGLTPVEVATISSIAEEETNNRAERATVGRLYLNRVKKGMMLQADPTVKYAVGDFTLRRILKKHLDTASPYNTYRNKGLPPGPIRMVEKATMEGLLNSAPNDYLYMCAKPDFSGTHNFTSDWETHKKNARAYQKALNERGVKGQ